MRFFKVREKLDGTWRGGRKKWVWDKGKRTERWAGRIMMRLSLKVLWQCPLKHPLCFLQQKKRERASEQAAICQDFTLQSCSYLIAGRRERAWQLSVTPALAFAGRRENACKGRTECWILLILQEGFLSTNYSKVALLWGNSLPSHIRTLTRTPFCPWGEKK